MKIDEETTEEGWETVVDFTDGGKKAGMPIENVIKLLKKFSDSHGENRKTTSQDSRKVS